MTIRQFIAMLEQVAEVQKMEMGGDDKQETSLSGDAGFALAKTIFPRGRSRRHGGL